MRIPYYSYRWRGYRPRPEYYVVMVIFALAAMIVGPHRWGSSSSRYASPFYSAAPLVVSAQGVDSSKVCRAPSCRSATVAREFMRLTGHCHVGTYGRVTCSWPGHIVDHMRPLECGGADAVDNMQWQTTLEAKAKDKLETQCGRWLPGPRSDGKPVPAVAIP